MVLIIALGVVMMFACLAIQIVGVVLVARRLSRPQVPRLGRRLLEVYLDLAWIMLVLLAAALLQIGAWAWIFWLLDQLDKFPDYETSLYFSGVTFTTLGYGDLTLPPRARILSVMEAVNGLMMFGVTSAVFMMAMQRSLGRLAGPRARDGAARPQDESEDIRAQ